MKKSEILVVGAGINGLVAANYLNKSGVNVTLIDQSERVGGACISEVAQINGENFHYALGASVLGLMQDFIFEESFRFLLDRISKAKVNKEFPAKIAVNSLNFL